MSRNIHKVETGKRLTFNVNIQKVVSASRFVVVGFCDVPIFLLMKRLDVCGPHYMYNVNVDLEFSEPGLGSCLKSAGRTIFNCRS